MKLCTPSPGGIDNYLTKTSVSGMGNFPLSCWIEKPKQYKILPSVALVKILLKTPHNSNTRFGGIDLDLTEKIPL